MLKSILVILLLVVAVNAVALSVDTDRAVYFLGDVVTVTLTNNGVGPVQLASWPPFCPYYLEDAVSLECVGLPVVTTIQPGDSVSAEHDTALGGDAPGHYMIEVLDGYVIYRLIQAVGTGERTWGAMKALYR